MGIWFFTLICDCLRISKKLRGGNSENKKPTILLLFVEYLWKFVGLYGLVMNDSSVIQEIDDYPLTYLLTY